MCECVRASPGRFRRLRSSPRPPLRPCLQHLQHHRLGQHPRGVWGGSSGGRPRASASTRRGSRSARP